MERRTSVRHVARAIGLTLRSQTGNDRVCVFDDF